MRGGFESLAPAKVNLTLHVGAPLSDGYHPLVSVVGFAADAADRVRAEPSTALSLRLVGPFASALEADADNLVLRAARALANAAGVPARAALTLEKNLPIASGIGGGSADAAAALRCVMALWQVALSDTALAEVALALGADVPVCLNAQSAIMRGRGERVMPCELAPLWAVLINPLTPAPTGAVFRAFDAAGAPGQADGDPPPARADTQTLLQWLAGQRNDLTTAAIAVVPDIGDVLAALTRLSPDHLARLSGSGATVAVYCASAADADALRAKVAAKAPHWWVCASRVGSVDVAVRAL